MTETNLQLGGGYTYQWQCAILLARTALVEYLSVDTVKANAQAKLQACGHRDWKQAYAVLFEHSAKQSTHSGGGSVTRESIVKVLGASARA